MSEIVLSGLSFSWPDDTPVFAHLSATFPGAAAGGRCRTRVSIGASCRE
jgi:hypothetical protein